VGSHNVTCRMTRVNVLYFNASHTSRYLIYSSRTKSGAELIRVNAPDLNPILSGQCLICLFHRDGQAGFEFVVVRLEMSGRVWWRRCAEVATSLCCCCTSESALRSSTPALLRHRRTLFTVLSLHQLQATSTFL